MMTEQVDIAATGRRVRRGVGLAALCLVAAAGCLGLGYLALVAMYAHPVFSATTPHNYPAAWYMNVDYEAGLVEGGRAARYQEGITRESSWPGEYKFQPGSIGEQNWINDQIAQAVRRKSGFVEPDNLESKPIDWIKNLMRQIDAAGLKFVGKNLNAKQVEELGKLRGRDGTPIMVGNTFEVDNTNAIMKPQQYDAARRAAGLPDLPGRFVSFGKGEQGPGIALESATIQNLAKEAAKYRNMATHWAPEEYRGSKVVAAPGRPAEPRRPQIWREWLQERRRSMFSASPAPG
jgi:hypothetical protein